MGCHSSRQVAPAKEALHSHPQASQPQPQQRQQWFETAAAAAAEGKAPEESTPPSPSFATANSEGKALRSPSGATAAPSLAAEHKDKGEVRQQRSHSGDRMGEAAGAVQGTAAADGSGLTAMKGEGSVVSEDDDDDDDDEEEEEATTVYRSKGAPELWRKGEMIGEGTLSVVFLGLNDDSGQLVAVKDTDFVTEALPIMQQLATDMEVLESLKHKHIVKYIGCEITVLPNHFLRFTDWIPGGDLRVIMKKFGKFRETVVRQYALQMLTGITYLHMNGFAHGNLTSSNVLVDDRGTIKLSDYGVPRNLLQFVRSVHRSPVIAPSRPAFPLAPAAAAAVAAPLQGPLDMDMEAIQQPQPFLAVHAGAAGVPSATATAAVGGAGDATAAATAAAGNGLSQTPSFATAGRRSRFPGDPMHAPPSSSSAASAASTSGVAASDAMLYSSPEVLLAGGIEKLPVLTAMKADIWSFGCILIEMVTGKALWSYRRWGSEESLAAHMLGSNMAEALPPQLSEHFRSFLLRCLQLDAASRPSAMELLRHEFLSPPGAALRGGPFEGSTTTTSEAEITEAATLGTHLGSASASVFSDDGLRSRHGLRSGTEFLASSRMSSEAAELRVALHQHRPVGGKSSKEIDMADVWRKDSPRRYRAAAPFPSKKSNGDGAAAAANPALPRPSVESSQARDRSLVDASGGTASFASPSSGGMKASSGSSMLLTTSSAAVRAEAKRYIRRSLTMPKRGGPRRHDRSGFTSRGRKRGQRKAPTKHDSGSTDDAGVFLFMRNKGKSRRNSDSTVGTSLLLSEQSEKGTSVASSSDAFNSSYQARLTAIFHQSKGKSLSSTSSSGKYKTSGTRSDTTTSGSSTMSTTGAAINMSSLLRHTATTSPRQEEHKEEGGGDSRGAEGQEEGGGGDAVNDSSSHGPLSASPQHRGTPNPSPTAAADRNAAWGSSDSDSGRAAPHSALELSVAAEGASNVLTGNSSSDRASLSTAEYGGGRKLSTIISNSAGEEEPSVIAHHFMASDFSSARSPDQTPDSSMQFDGLGWISEGQPSLNTLPLQRETPGSQAARESEGRTPRG